MSEQQEQQSPPKRTRAPRPESADVTRQREQAARAIVQGVVDDISGATTGERARPADVAANVLNDMVNFWREQASRIADARRQGWQGRSRDLERFAAELAGMAIEVGHQRNHDIDWAGDGGHLTVDPYAHNLPAPPADLELTPEQVAKLNNLADASLTLTGAFDFGQTLNITEHGLSELLAERIGTYDNERGAVLFVDPQPPADTRRPRLTFADVQERARFAQQGREHRSVSQVYEFADCGIRYALRGDDVPAWWNVGGSAVHSVAEYILHSVLPDGTPMELNEDGRRALWDDYFARAIALQAQASTVPLDQWRTAKRGLEGYDWWRVEGPRLIANFCRWLDERWSQGWRIATDQNSLPMIEHEINMPVDSQLDITIKAKPDLVMDRPTRDGTPEFLIPDFKAGASKPDDTFQLGVYAHALDAVVNSEYRPEFDVSAEYVMLRTAETIPVADPLALHPWDEIVYRVSTMDRAEKQGLYLVNRGRHCVSCGVNDLCPVGPR